MDNAAESLLSLALPIHGYVVANEQTDFLFISLRVYAAIYRARNVRTKSTHFSPFSLKIVNIHSKSSIRHTTRQSSVSNPPRGESCFEMSVTSQSRHMHTSSANVVSGWEVRLVLRPAAVRGVYLANSPWSHAPPMPMPLMVSLSLSLSRLQTNASSPSFPLWPPLRSALSPCLIRESPAANKSHNVAHIER